MWSKKCQFSYTVFPWASDVTLEIFPQAGRHAKNISGQKIENFELDQIQLIKLEYYSDSDANTHTLDFDCAYLYRTWSSKGCKVLPVCKRVVLPANNKPN